MKTIVKRILPFLLFATLLLGSVLTVSAATLTWKDVHDGGSATYQAYQVAASGPYGYRIKINAAFNAFKIRLDPNGGTTSSCTVSVYAWDNDYVTTTKGEPVFIQKGRALNEGTNAWYQFDIGKDLPAGEYLFCVGDAVGTVNILTDIPGNPNADPNLTSKGYYYQNGTEKKGNEMILTVGFTGAVEEPFSACEASMVPAGTHAVTQSTAGANFKGSPLVNEAYGYRAIVNVPFNKVNIQVVTAADITVGVYQWKGTYAATVAETPLRETTVAHELNQWINWTLDSALPAGEYLFLVTAPESETLQLFIENLSTDTTLSATKGFCYEDGVEIKTGADVRMTLVTTEAAVKTVFGTCVHTHVFDTYITNNGGTHTATCSSTLDGDCTVTDTKECFGGEANCTKGAICNVCGDEYTNINADNHDYADTLTIGETTHYYACSRCNSRKDEDGHTYGDYTSNGDDMHSATCICGDVDTLDCSGGEATCSSPATCETCHESYGTIDETAHDWADTLTVAPESHYYVCSLCERHKDEADHQYSGWTSLGNNTHSGTCICGDTTILNCHGGEATCINLAVCDDCGHTYGGVGRVHAYADTLTSDETTHYYVCAHCNSRKDEAAHTATAWTAAENNTHEGTCVCGKALTETCSATDATCAAPQTCTGCGRTMADALAHTPDEWTTTKEPAPGQAGTATQSCAVCGKLLNEKTLDALPEETDPTETQPTPAETEPSPDKDNPVDSAPVIDETQPTENDTQPTTSESKPGETTGGSTTDDQDKGCSGVLGIGSLAVLLALAGAAYVGRKEE